MKRALLLLLLAGCGPLDVVVADVPVTDGGRPMMSRPCGRNQDCMDRDFCEKPTCADPVGRCRPRPVFCDQAPAPVCGCDGVTYWNDCLRRASGSEAKTDGECTDTAQHCGPDAGTCGIGRSCAQLLPETATCGPPGQGDCWALPMTCPQGPNNGGAWISCGGPGQCTDVCQAIRSQQPHRRASVCP